MAKLLREHRLIAFSNGAAYNIIADEYVTSYHIGAKRIGWAMPCLIDHVVKKRDMHGLSLSEWCDKYLWKEIQ